MKLFLPILAAGLAVGIPSTKAATDKTLSAEIDGVEFAWTVHTPGSEIESGTFVDGQPWVVVPPEGLELVAATPSRINAAEVQDRRGNPLTADINITVINPPLGDSYEDRVPSGPTLAPEAAAFGWDSRGSIMYGTGRRFNSAIGWDGKTPVPLKPGDIVTTPKSLVEMELDNNNPNYQVFHETVLEAVAVLTVLAEAPPDDAFRPGVLRSPERKANPEFFRLSDMRDDLDENLISAPTQDLFGNALDPENLPPQFTAERLTSLMPGPGVMNTGFNDARGSHAFRNNSGATYSSDISMNMGDALIGAQADWLTPEQRQICRVRFLQRSIDVYEAILAGLPFAHDGGMMTAYGLRMAVAGHMLNHEGMRKMDQEVQGMPPWFWMGDYSQFIYVGDPENPGPDAPPTDSPRFLDVQSTEFAMAIDGLPVAEAGPGSLKVPDDYRWPTYRAARDIPNLRLQVVEGPGSGDQIYTVSGIRDYTDSDSGKAGKPASPRIDGGTLSIKPDWINGTPTADSKVVAFPVAAGQANRWLFKSSGNIRNNRTLQYDRTRVTQSPDTDYGGINIGAYLSMIIGLYAINGQDAYSAGADKWMISISEIPGYGEVIFNSDRSRNAAAPTVHPAHPDRPFLGGLWRSVVLEPLGKTFVHTGNGLEALPVVETNKDGQE